MKVIGPIRSVELIATGRSIRERRRLMKAYGQGRWRKMKGIATLELDDGDIVMAEVHWYEAHGIGKRELKVKKFLAS